MQTSNSKNIGMLVLGVVLAAVSDVSYAQTTSAPTSAAAHAADDSLTFRGITLFGIVDLGLQYQTHGAPISDYYPAGSADIVQKNSNHSVTGITPSNMAQSRIGLTGVEPLAGDWSAMFKLETFFNPHSGQLSDGLKSLVQNNGRALVDQNTNLDSSVAGQIFQQSYFGVSSKTFGTVTFGRQNTLLHEGVGKYDPNYASQAFSLIGLSGAAAGGGATQDRRLDATAKYLGSFGLAHVGALYKFNQSRGAANTAVQVAVGGDYAGVSVDAFYSKIKGAVAASGLNAGQVAGLSALGFSPSNSLAGTISDNTTFSLMGLYKFGAAKFFAGYEHIQYANPSDPVAPGFDAIGGYKLAYINNAAFPNDKVLQVYWAGLRYSVTPALDLTGAVYAYRQNAYGSGANAGCNSTQSGTCKGALDAFSFNADYRLAKRFDAYAGIMYTGAHDGLASGYLNRTDINPTIGARYKF